MDLELAEPAPDTTMSRRSLVARAGFAGFAGLAASLVADRAVLAAAAPTSEQPIVPTSSDQETLILVIGFELAASELYTAALAVADEKIAPAVGVMAGNHRAYAQALAGATGLSADASNADVLDAFLDDFTGSTNDFLTAAHTLEQQAVATHTSLISGYESADAVEITASIAIIEARHATVLADLLAVDDLDTLFGNDESALELTASGDA